MGQSDLSAEEQAAKADRDIEIWKIKKLIRWVEAARGCVHALSLVITQRRAALPFAGNTSERRSAHVPVPLSGLAHTLAVVAPPAAAHA